MTRRILIPILLLIILAVIASACQPSVSDAKQQFCDHLNKVNAAVDKLQNLDANSSVEDAKQAKKELEDAWQNFTKAADQLKGVQADASEDAFNAVQKDLEDSISGESTLGESAQKISASAQKLAAAPKVINTTVCSVK